MKRRIVHILPIGVIMAACVQTSDVGPEARTPEFKALELAAVGKLQCAWENQERCNHMIDKRTLFPRFFAAEGLGGLTEDAKANGRRVTTKFIVEATGSINQCRPVNDKSIVLLKNVQIAKKLYQVEGTSPLDANSSCFLAPLSESS